MPKWAIWTYVGFACFYIIFGVLEFLAKRYSSEALYFGNAVFFLFVPITRYIIPIYIYYEIDATRLCLHKFGKKKEISLHDVRSVSRFGFTDSLSIFFGHQVDDYGSTIVSPAKREQFISTMRQYAPQAEIDV